jgi:aspartyl protease family protein
MLLVAGFPAYSDGSLRDSIETAARDGGFAVEGLERLGAEPAETVQGRQMERLRTLLRDYNYLAIESSPGVLQRLVIASRKTGDRPGSADKAHVNTTRVGAHHQVETTLAGPNGVGKTLALIIDTGASTLVLPTSMIAELGFGPTDLRDGLSQTASGTVPVKLADLRWVRVGAVAAQRVPVSFIDDTKLQGSMLLGMSFLQRFRITIDDARNELILLVK